MGEAHFDAILARCPMHFEVPKYGAVLIPGLRLTAVLLHRPTSRSSTGSARGSTPASKARRRPCRWAQVGPWVGS